MNPPPSGTQKAAVFLAFVAAGLSLTAVFVRVYQDGALDATPLFGGLFMLVLGIGGYLRLKRMQ